MADSKSLTVGIISPDGEYSTLTEGAATHPDSIERIVVPVSLPWEDDVVLITRAPEEVERHERNMGRESYYTVRFEGTVPNSDSQHYSVKVDFHEYPRGQFQILEGEHTGPARLAHFSPDDLLSYMHVKL